MAKLRRAKIEIADTPSLTTESTEGLVTPLNDRDLVVSVQVSTKAQGTLTTLRVYRLLYHGVPEIKVGNDGKVTRDTPADTQSIAARALLVRRIHAWLVNINDSGDTALEALKIVARWIRYCDANDLPVIEVYKSGKRKGQLKPLSKKPLLAYCDHLRERILHGTLLSSTARVYKSFLEMALNGIGENEIAGSLPHFASKGNKSTQSYDDPEICAITRRLKRIVDGLGADAVKGNEPTCPLGIDAQTWAEHHSNSTAWKVKLVVAAYYLVLLLTGDNATPLQQMRRRDIGTFKREEGDNWKLTTYKGRQGGKPNEWELGFTTFGKRFFEYWLTVAEHLDPNPDAFLFPKIIDNEVDGNIAAAAVKDFNNWFCKLMPQQIKAEQPKGATDGHNVTFELAHIALNDVLEAHIDKQPVTGFTVDGRSLVLAEAPMKGSEVTVSYLAGVTAPRLVPRRFRATKSDLLIAVSDSTLVAAEGLNNGQSTVERSYSNGNTHKNQSRAAMASEFIQRSAQGESVEQAKQAVGFKFKQPITLRELEAKYPQKTETENIDYKVIPAQTDVGTRCTEPFGDKAQRLKKELMQSGLATEDDQVACFRFLECFGCEHQAVLAEVDDIWCLLSFQASLEEAKQGPAVNHVPPEILTRVEVTIEQMLSDIQRDYPEVLAAAQEKCNHAPHPVFDNEYAVNDLYLLWEGN
ncbi:hypothetical protein [Vibrio sp. McD22-P3]|uniref:hypothetical protein n=1 Tax=Vibrio sp. McD22-P3 TaxID=2724880 RepID=UPI001F1AC523|nr:hypothetical protein [Vibrio sp. McD22-P3]MCF4174723.1 hypothetical protein [Vibrio sp. McD22-P3]